MADSLKANVRFGSNVFAMCIADGIIHQVYLELGYPCVITSANDSKHGTGSLHPEDGALDYRTHHLPDDATKNKLIKMVKERLNSAFDVILESLHLPEEHMHVEHDPKIR